jgi:hypothetical protein
MLPLENDGFFFEGSQLSDDIPSRVRGSSGTRAAASLSA